MKATTQIENPTNAPTRNLHLPAAPQALTALSALAALPANTGSGLAHLSDLQPVQQPSCIQWPNPNRFKGPIRPICRTNSVQCRLGKQRFVTIYKICCPSMHDTATNICLDIQQTSSRRSERQSCQPSPTVRSDATAGRGRSAATAALAAVTATMCTASQPHSCDCHQRWQRPQRPGAVTAGSGYDMVPTLP